VELPTQAPDWASPLVEALLAAGFTPGAEVRGGMAGYSVALTRDDCTVTLGGDRGDFDVDLSLRSPRHGRGHSRTRTMPLEDYVAAARGDADATLLLSSSRHEEATRWLRRRVGQPQPLTLDEVHLSRIDELQRERARALFG
jgi:hypothetical protein